MAITTARQLDLFAAGPLFAAAPRTIAATALRPIMPKPLQAQAVDLAKEHEAKLRAWTPANMVSRDQHGRPQVQTRAASHGGLITLYHPEDPEPFEVVVRGIPCVIAFHGGFATHAIEPHGSRFWSETGYRSFGPGEPDPEAIVAAIERYIAAPAKDGNGCGGKLRPWWPHWVRDWQQSLAFELNYATDRAETWAQWGPEKHAEHWAKHDQKLADAMARMRAEGINPDDVGPPDYFKGKWPQFGQAALL